MKKYHHTESPRGFTAILFCLMVVALAIACGGGGDSGEDVAEPGTTEELAAQEESSGAPRVFFAEPSDGATVTSPVTFTFGHENYTIEPKGEVHAGAGHHHIGLEHRLPPAGRGHSGSGSMGPFR